MSVCLSEDADFLFDFLTKDDSDCCLWVVFDFTGRTSSFSLICVEFTHCVSSKSLPSAWFFVVCCISSVCEHKLSRTSGSPNRSSSDDISKPSVEIKDDTVTPVSLAIFSKPFLKFTVSTLSEVISGFLTSNCFIFPLLWLPWALSPCKVLLVFWWWALFSVEEIERFNSLLLLYVCNGVLSLSSSTALIALNSAESSSLILVPCCDNSWPEKSSCLDGWVFVSTF